MLKELFGKWKVSLTEIAFEFFTVCTKLAEMAFLYSKDLTTAKKRYQLKSDIPEKEPISSRFLKTKTERHATIFCKVRKSMTWIRFWMTLESLSEP